ncbi:MAG: enoyl-CoA hydratase [Pseudomonadota bacterium]|nr:enoyl-CoA hydratase [Pseudomonadota bacterium]
MSNYENILVEIDDRAEGRVARLTLNRPAKLNAMSTAMNLEIRDAAMALARDPDLRVMVLTGAGDRAFVGGADIDEMSRLDGPSGRTFITNLHLAIEAVREMPVPVIGRLNGWCLGGGLELAAACDFRVAVAGAKLGMPEVRVGMPSVIEAVLLPRIMGWGKASEILLTGDNLTAEEALACGLVQKVVPREGLDAQVEAWIHSILVSGPKAVRIQKRLIRSWQDLPIDAAIKAAIDAFEEAHSGPEPRTYLAKARGKH